VDDAGALRRECASSAVLLGISGAYVAYGVRYPLDTLANPGPGVFPLAVGLFLVGLTAFQLLRSGGRLLRATADGLRLGPDAPQAAASARRPWLMIAILTAYLVVVTPVGFYASTLALAFLCSKLMGTRGWVRPLVLAAGLLLACYVLFSVWLKVPLPRGYLG
jgi:putative tricarboxylic transport membrane protein